MTNVGTRYVVGTSNEIEYRREMSKKKKRHPGIVNVEAVRT